MRLRPLVVLAAILGGLALSGCSESPAEPAPASGCGTIPSLESGTLEVQDVFTVSIDELRSTHRGTLPARFGATIGE